MAGHHTRPRSNAISLHHIEALALRLELDSDDRLRGDESHLLDLEIAHLEGLQVKSKASQKVKIQTALSRGTSSPATEVKADNHTGLGSDASSITASLHRRRGATDLTSNSLSLVGPRMTRAEYRSGAHNKNRRGAASRSDRLRESRIMQQQVVRPGPLRLASNMQTTSTSASTSTSTSTSTPTHASAFRKQALPSTSNFSSASGTEAPASYLASEARKKLFSSEGPDMTAEDRLAYMNDFYVAGKGDEGAADEVADGEPVAKPIYDAAFQQGGAHRRTQNVLTPVKGNNGGMEFASPFTASRGIRGRRDEYDDLSPNDMGRVKAGREKRDKQDDPRALDGTPTTQAHLSASTAASLDAEVRDVDGDEMHRAPAHSSSSAKGTREVSTASGGQKIGDGKYRLLGGGENGGPRMSLRGGGGEDFSLLTDDDQLDIDEHYMDHATQATRQKVLHSLSANDQRDDCPVVDAHDKIDYVEVQQDGGAHPDVSQEVHSDDDELDEAYEDYVLITLTEMVDTYTPSMANPDEMHYPAIPELGADKMDRAAREKAVEDLRKGCIESMFSKLGLDDVVMDLKGKC